MKHFYRLIIILPVILSIAALSGCPGKTKTETQKLHGPQLAFIFPSDEFVEGEAVCLRVVFYNNTSDTIGFEDFPLKNLSLKGSEGELKKTQRTQFPKPPRMLLHPGDSSADEINLTGLFENSGPGMLKPGEYVVRTSLKFFVNQQIKFKLEGFQLTDSALFSVVPASGKEKEALEAYLEAMRPAGGVEAFIGKPDIKLSEEVREALDSVALKYPKTGIGARLSLNDLGIWHHSIPLERYGKYLLETPANCPCCLHRLAIDKLIKRYVISEEREMILDIAEQGLSLYPAGTPVGDYLRKAFAFRMENDKIIR